MSSNLSISDLLFIEPKVTRIFEYSSSHCNRIFSVELGFPDELEQALPLLMAILFSDMKLTML